MNERSNTKRFTDRVKNYVKYRPEYPAAIFAYLEENIGLTAQTMVADVGAGTGIFTRQLTGYGCKVFAVEPNDGMREEMEAAAGSEPNFLSVAAPAEQTSLPDNSVDVVTAAHAYHWFDRDKARIEFQRILRPGGHIALIWNVQNFELSFMKKQEKIIRQYAVDYENTSHKTNSKAERDADLEAFFSPGKIQRAEFEYHQIFDYEGLKGRALSSSYTPTPGHANYNGLLGALKLLFDEYQADGTVTYSYITRLFYARID